MARSPLKLATPEFDPAAEAREVLRRGSKTFSFASHLLPSTVRDDVAILYAWCRRVDDAVDDNEPDDARAALSAIEEELDAAYDDRRSASGRFGAPMRYLSDKWGIPRKYPADLLAGMRSDLHGAAYETMDDLLLYAYQAAGTVGLMMAHILGVRTEAALPHAAHLGMAMQITNVCRDVAEDLGRDRVYLPRERLAKHGAQALTAELTEVSPDLRRRTAQVVRELLVDADRLYDTGLAGAGDLPARAGFAIRTAGELYRAIGDRLARQGYDPFVGRAYVPLPSKLVILGRTMATSCVAALSGQRFVRAALPPERPLRFPEDILGMRPLQQLVG